MLICSLLDIAGLPIVNSFLENIGVLSQAYYLEHATLYVTDGSWKTIHPSKKGVKEYVTEEVVTSSPNELLYVILLLINSKGISKRS